MKEKIQDSTHARQRTSQQNRALHLFCQILAQNLNNAGLDVRTLLKPGINIPWTMESVKLLIWHPIQKAMYGTNSTAFLRKQEQIDSIHSVIMRELGDKHGVEYLPFPSDYEDISPLKNKKYD